MKWHRKSITCFFILVFGFVLVAFQPAHAFWGKSAVQEKKDQVRINDLLKISGYIEAYYQKLGHYPFVVEPQKNMVTSVISDFVPQELSPDVSYTVLEEELARGLGQKITLPKDPDEGQDWRIYQYATDGQVYYVSAFLYYENPYAKAQGWYHHKLEITSRPHLKYQQFKRRDIERYQTFGLDKPALQKELFQAIQARDFTRAKEAIDKGANLSPSCGFNERCQPLASAAFEGDLELLQFLMDSGADLDGYNAYFDVALIYALESQHIDAAKMLINAGANVNLANAFGVSPFIGVCFSKDPELVMLMVKHGANLDRNYLMANSSAERGEKNFRPLEAAIKSGSADVVSLLLDAGADPFLKNGKGKTMHELGLEAENTEIQRLFKRYK